MHWPEETGALREDACAATGFSSSMVMAKPSLGVGCGLGENDSGHLAVRGQQRAAGVAGLDVTGQPVDVLRCRVVAVDVRHQDGGDVLDGGRLGLERTAVGVAGERGRAAAGKVCR